MGTLHVLNGKKAPWKNHNKRPSPMTSGRRRRAATLAQPPLYISFSCLFYTYSFWLSSYTAPSIYKYVLYLPLLYANQLLFAPPLLALTSYYCDTSRHRPLGVVSCEPTTKMRLYQHSIRLFVMHRHTSQIAAAAGTAGYKNHAFNSSHNMRYLSTVLPDDDRSSVFTQQMQKLSEKQRQTRLKFLEAEAKWDAQIVWDNLTGHDIKIVETHKKAVLNGHFTYDDCKLGKKVMTRLRHFLRGSCCGSACRHVCDYHVSLFTLNM